MFIIKCSLIILLVNSVQPEPKHSRFFRYAGTRRNSPGTCSFNEFHRYDEIVSYMQNLKNQFPNRVQVIDMGQSYEGRTIYAVRISTNLNQRERPAIMVEAGIHAREWASPATATYLIHKLAEDEKYVNMISKVDWIIVPVLNPDGYEYTHTKDRMWRKNRAKGKRCDGIDLNRNFGFHWMEKDSSQNECSEIYAGTSAFSEKETVALKYLVSKFKDQIKLYISLHSFGPMILYPWSYTQKITPSNAEEHAVLARNIANAIKQVKGGSVYKFGSSTEIYYPISGVSDDWAKGAMGVPLIFTIELPPGGRTGFDPPPENILPVGRETFEGFKVMFKHVVEKTNTASKKI